MENASIGGQILTQMVVTLREYFINTYTTLADEFYITASLMVTLYIVFMGYRMIKGEIGDSLKEFLIAFIVIPLCFGIFFNISIFETIIYQPIISTMLGLMGIAMGADAFSFSLVFKPIDNSFAEIFAAVENVMNQMARFDIGQKILVSLVSIGLSLTFGLLYLIFVVLIAGALFAVHVLIVLGPIFGTLAAFKKTRGHFTQWLKTILNYALIPVFTAIIMGITLQFLNVAIQDIGNIDIDRDGIFTKAVGGAFIVGFLSIYIHLKAPELANAITGGQASGVGNFFGGMAAVAGGGVAAAGMLGGNKIVNASKTAAGAGMKNLVENGAIGMVQNGYSRLRGFMN